MWPGILSIAAERCPQGGTAMFALLALGGTVGCSAGPTAVGIAAGATGGDIRLGLSFGTIFPVIMVIGVAVLMAKFKSGREGK
jgi:MFS-type transporter involved in bile tolerance (Atg22 family)